LGNIVQLIRSGVHDQAFCGELWEGVRVGRFVGSVEIGGV
jgi:hypothetical protein